MPLRKWIVLAPLIGLGLVLVGCAPSSRAAGAASSTSSPASPSSPAPSATAQQTIGAGGQRCIQGAGDVRIGDLAISKPTVLYGFNADYKLPDTIATNKPLTVTIQDNVGRVATGQKIRDLPVVRPMAFLVDVCNTSTTATHHLSGLGVTLQSLTPYAGQLNALNACAELYARTGGLGGECISGYSPDVEVSLAFPANAIPQATITQALPQSATLAPGQSLGISIGITPPTTTAIMTYRIGLGIDGQPITYPSALTTQQAIYAPIARRWAGDYCSTAQMQSLIPATSPAGTYYVCPKV